MRLLRILRPRFLQFMAGGCWGGLLLAATLGAAEAPPAEESFAVLQQRASAGVASAQYYLALRYSHGVDVARDDVVAAEWFAKAALQGDVAAERSLALLLRDGAGLPKDRAAAREWLRPLAPRMPAAAAKLGELLLYGEGGAAEPEAAAQWLRQAAAQADPAGQFLYSQALEQGLGVKADPREARRWLEQAAEAKDPRAEQQLAQLLLEGGPDAAAMARAVALLAAAAGQGLPVAQHTLARLLEEGRGVPADLPRAAGLYREAALSGFAPAQASLGRMLVLGRGVVRDPAEAVRWFKEAAKGDEPAAEFNLGLLAEAGIGGPRDAAVAAAHHLQAARLGFGPAQLRYAQLLQAGRGVAADAAEAAAWAALAAEGGASDAEDFLAKLAPEARVAARVRARELQKTIARPGAEARDLRAAAKDPALGKAQLPRLTGTAFALRSDGLAVTSFKLVAGAKEIRVLVGGVPRPARVLGGEERTDLALLQIDGATLPVLPLADTALRLGDPVAAVGLPDQLVRPGEVLWMAGQVVLAGRAAEGELVGLDRYWPAPAAGGVLLDSAGRVRGVLTQVADRTVAPQGETSPAAFARDLGFVAPLTVIGRIAREQKLVWAVPAAPVDEAARPSRDAVAAALLPVLVY